MIGKVVKYYAIAQAPKLAYSISHPKNAARLAKTGWDLKHAWAPRITGVAALAVALPLGYLLGRMTRDEHRPRMASSTQPLGTE
jgi:hypothetical protein